AIPLLIKAADAGSDDAAFLLGRCHEQGLGVRIDPLTALRWYGQAAEHDHGDAAQALGRVRELVAKDWQP
ncbi:MAG: SEL1-like repeat protein, partial [Planctomycetes bacterium]|nr:SEL1-like repeat protein [Planctomycetota bacterium]